MTQRSPRPGTSRGPLGLDGGHRKIADLIRRSEVLAVRGDEEALHDTARQVLHTLSRHIADERGELKSLEALQRGRLAAGQQTLLERANHFAAHPATDIGADLLALLVRQADAEEAAFRTDRHPRETSTTDNDRVGFITDWTIGPGSWVRRDRQPSGRREKAMYPLTTLSHDQLLELADNAVQAARDHDPDRVESNTLRLLDAITEHALAEQPAFLHLQPADARLLRRGQQSIVDLLLELAASAAQKVDRCECEHLAEDVVVDLVLQAEDERRQLLAVAD